MQKRVLVTEELDPAGISVLKTRGLDVTFKPGIDEDALVSIIGDYDGLIVRSHTQVTRRVIEAAAGRLKVIGLPEFTSRNASGIEDISITMLMTE